MAAKKKATIAKKLRAKGVKPKAADALAARAAARAQRASKG
jgi:hypothetical protein